MPPSARIRISGGTAFNILVGMVWQIAMVAMLMYLVIQQYTRMFICLAVFVATSAILKFTWYDRLGPGEMYLTTADGNLPETEPESRSGASTGPANR